MSGVAGRGGGRLGGGRLASKIGGRWGGIGARLIFFKWWEAGHTNRWEMGG